MTKIRNFAFQICLIIGCFSLSTVNAAEFGLFGDVSYTDSNADGADGNSAFSIGGLDLYAQQYIDDKTRAFIEVVFENDGDGFVLDVERLWIKRSINENLNIGIGRFHTPLGYWNRTYHHGTLLYDTVTRPAFLDFEDGSTAVLPTHVVGLLADGEFRAPFGVIGYDFTYSNGPSYNTSDGFGAGEIEMNNVSDANNDKSIGLRMSFSPNDSNIEASFSYMGNVIAESGIGSTNSGIAQGDTLIDQVIIGLDVKYSGEQLDIIVEYFSLKNDDKFGTTGSHTGSVMYAQIGYQITDTLKPVYRYESIDFDAADVYRTVLGVLPEDRHVLALRKDLDDTNALKFQVTRINPEAVASKSITVYGMQWSFLIP